MTRPINNSPDGNSISQPAISPDALPDDGLPEDLAACQARIRELQEQLEHAQRVAEVAHARCDQLQQTCDQLREEVALLRRMLYGPKRERFIFSADPQLLLFDLHPVDAAAEIPEAEEESTSNASKSKKKRPGHGPRPFPEHLPRREVLLDFPEEQPVCGCCDQPMIQIGEDVSEVLDCEPIQLFVIRYIRPKYTCPSENHGVQTAPPAPKLVAGGRYGFGIATEIVVSRFCDHLPYYRQQGIFARSGIVLARSSLCSIVRDTAKLLEPLYELLREQVLQSAILWTDDTQVCLLDQQPGSRKASFWVYLGDEAHPYDVYDFTISRKRDGPAKFLDGFEGYLQADAYSGYDGIFLNSAGKITEVACWAHARRKFEQAQASDSRRAQAMLAWIQALYEIEDRAGELDPQDRLAMRQREALPILDAMESWLEAEAKQALPKSKIGKAITYARNQWEALRRYTEDGRLSIDNNASERCLRQQAIGRKNWLFLGGENAGEQAAILYSILSSAGRHDLDPWAYLHTILPQLADPSPNLEDLLPDRWAQTHPQHVHTFRQREREQKQQAKRKNWAKYRAEHASQT